jgi:hypothetical protein
VKGTRLKHTGKLVNQAKQIGPIKATANRRTNEELSAVTRFSANTSRSKLAGNQKVLDFILAIATMAAKGANCSEFAGISPTSHSLWIDPK